VFNVEVMLRDVVILWPELAVLCFILISILVSRLCVTVEYNHTSKLEVSRKSRSFLRLLKSSKSFKLEIWYKRCELQLTHQLFISV